MRQLRQEARKRPSARGHRRSFSASLAAGLLVWRGLEEVPGFTPCRAWRSVNLRRVPSALCGALVERVRSRAGEPTTPRARNLAGRLTSCLWSRDRWAERATDVAPSARLRATADGRDLHVSGSVRSDAQVIRDDAHERELADVEDVETQSAPPSYHAQ